MNKKKIEEMIDLMEKHGLTEINIEEEGIRIHLKKGPSGYEQIRDGVISKPVTLPKEEKAQTIKEAKNLTEIKSPMVGTFYSAPGPDTPPFIEIGDTIKEGDVLCIIEAMKLMNEIKSEVKGKVSDILVENGEPVEFGQVLFLVEP
ncbi:MAG: acetyl-CoA carboxylase biotin carboxyl carrier protein [Candidatus Omnitrophica bacterium]|nr:acetyl-CoA carboxylase biotin carboxyl carrier protein [Candidatus Omnitrophota bacterium]